MTKRYDPTADSSPDISTPSSQKEQELQALSDEWLDFVQEKRGLSDSSHSDRFILEIINLWLLKYERELRQRRSKI